MHPAKFQNDKVMCVRSITLAFFSVLGGWICAAPARAENWPQWRGPAFNGSTTDAGAPAQFSKTEGVAWVAPLPGSSGSTPVVWGDNVFVSSPDAQKNLLLFCLNRRDGSVRWQKQVAVGDKSGERNNMTSPSPVARGKSPCQTCPTTPGN